MITHGETKKKSDKTMAATQCVQYAIQSYPSDVTLDATFKTSNQRI